MFRHLRRNTAKAVSDLRVNASIVGSGEITFFGHPSEVTPNVVGSGHTIPAE